MSWIESVTRVEDAFDDDVDDGDLLNKEWKHNMEKRTKDGFRDGMDAGRKAALQAAFNDGYRQEVSRVRAVAHVRGMMSAVRCWCQAQLPESPALASVSDLLQRAEKHEDALIQAIRKAQEKPPASVTEMTEDMEDLNVKQRGDSGACDKDEDCCGNDGGMDGCGTDEDSSRIASPSSFCTDVSFEQLQMSCLDLVTQLGMPEELKCFIQQLKDG